MKGVKATINSVPALHRHTHIALAIASFATFSSDYTAITALLLRVSRKGRPHRWNFVETATSGGVASSYL